MRFIENGLSTTHEHEHKDKLYKSGMILNCFYYPNFTGTSGPKSGKTNYFAKKNLATFTNKGFTSLYLIGT